MLHAHESATGTNEFVHSSVTSSLFFFLFRNNKQGGGGGHAFPISTVKMRLFEGKPASGLRKEGISLEWGRKIKTQRNLDQVQVERRGFFFAFSFYFTLFY